MPRNPSTMKKLRQSIKRRQRNRAARSSIRTFSKKAISAAEQGDLDTAEKYQKVVQGLADKATKGSTLHKNTAARKKSRLAKRLEKLREAQG